MNRAIGLIDCTYSVDRLQVITTQRPVGTVPFGGRYRLLDFALSSMANSGIRTVGLVTLALYRSLVDHLGAGKGWFLDRKAGGLFLLPGRIAVPAGTGKMFSLQNIKENIEFLDRDFAGYVVMSGCNQVFNINFQKALEFQFPEQADGILFYQLASQQAANSDQLFLHTSADGRVIKIFPADSDEGKGECKPPQGDAKRFLGVVIIRRKLLMDIVTGYNGGSTDVLSVVGANLGSMRVYAYPHLGYWASIDSIPSYFRHSLELLDPEIRAELFMGKDRILTKVKDSPPAKYGSEAQVRDCLVASGSYIEGQVERSVIFRKVHIYKGAQVKNAVVMQGCVIGKGAVLEDVILDKLVRIQEHTILRGTATNPLVLSKRSVR